MSAPEPPFQQAIHERYSDHHGWLRRKLDCSHNAADLAQVNWR